MIFPYKRNKQNQPKQPGPKMDLHTMPCHAMLRRGPKLLITRVPGGWIYLFLENPMKLEGPVEVPPIQAAVFVPYHEEFKKQPG